MSKDITLVTSASVNPIIDADAYAPAKAVNFHMVTFANVHTNKLSTIVCSDFVIKESVYTFFNVRMMKTYISHTPMKSTLRMYFNESGYDYNSEIRYRTNLANKHKVNGYREIPIKTVNRESVYDIESFTIAPDDKDWYAIDKEKAISICKIQDETTNEKIVKENLELLTDGDAMEFHTKFLDVIYRREYGKWKKLNWFKKHFTPEPKREDVKMENWVFEQVSNVFFDIRNENRDYGIDITKLQSIYYNVFDMTMPVIKEK